MSAGRGRQGRPDEQARSSPTSTRIERLPFHQSSASRPALARPRAAPPRAPGLRWTSTPSRRGPLVDLRRHGLPGEPARRCRRRPTGRPRSRTAPGMMPSSTTPHIPSASDEPRSPSTMWQVLVPITATIVPGSVTPTAGTETWASTLATATGVPRRSPSTPPPRPRARRHARRGSRPGATSCRRRPSRTAGRGR